MRTPNEIKQSIQNEFINNITLREMYGLESGDTFTDKFSPASLEAILIDTVSSAIYLYEKEVNDLRNELSARIASEYPFSVAWYYSRIRAFQIGHTLTFDTDSYRFSYPEIDESARIIKHAAIRQVLEDGITKLKIYAAKDGKEKLTPDEFEAFKSYMTQSGAAGTHFDFVPPADVDILTLEYTVYRDPQVLDSEGNLLSGSGKPVEDAVRNYVDSIRYSGVFSRTKSIDAIQSAAGVMDAVLLSVRLNEVPVDSLSFKSESGFFSAKTVSVTYPPYHDN